MKMSEVGQAAGQITKLMDLGTQRADLMSGDLELRATLGGYALPKVVTDELKTVVNEWLAAQQRIIRSNLVQMGVTGLPEVAA